MNFKEYGNKNKDTIMLLHGGGLSVIIDKNLKDYKKVIILLFQY